MDKGEPKLIEIAEREGFLEVQFLGTYELARFKKQMTLAAQASRVTGFLLRMAAAPQPSTAETRWIVRAAHSPPAARS